MIESKITSPFRVRINKKNKEWCPDENIRLQMFVEEHFIERFIERFSVEGMPFLIEIEKWIDKNYCQLLFDANVDDAAKKYRIKLPSGTVCLTLFNKMLRLRTCFIQDDSF